MKTNHSIRRAALSVTVAVGFFILAGCQASSGSKTADRGPSSVLPNNGAVPAVHHNQAAYGGQKTCPVTGEALGSMGAPISVNTPGGQTIYVCCRGCANRVLRDPATYSQKVEAERKNQ